jgi:hypothetical protein
VNNQIALSIIIVLLMGIMPVLGDLTDYQKGVTDGLTAGLRMGRLLGSTQYDPNAAQQYNQLVNDFNQGIAAIFGGNQTAMQMFWMTPISAYGGYPTRTVGQKPVHAFDASFNQTKYVLADSDLYYNYGRVYDWPISSYETWTGMVPKRAPEFDYEEGQALPGV